MEHGAPMLGVVLAVISFVLMLFGTPLLLYYVVRMGNYKRDKSESWHDFFGLNRYNLIFFPARLDDRGREYRGKALYGAKLLLAGASAGVVAMILLGKIP
jgi:hypothetical protein